MADRQPITIVREAVHIVKHWTPDNYGNILVTVAEQEEPIKISSKRANLADKIIADTQFKFKYANYMNRDYVADIECMEANAVESTATAVKTTVPNVGKPVPKMGTDDSRTRSMALSYAKDWCIAQLQANLSGGTKPTTKHILSIAIIFEGYITNGAETRQED